MKRKLLVITGAGASVEFGMPSVREIDLLFEKWALEVLPLKDNPEVSLYSWVKKSIRDYAVQNPKNNLDAIVNFENLLFTIQSLASMSLDEYWPRFGSLLRAFVSLHSFPEVVRFHKTKIADTTDFDMLVSHLVDRLLEHFREKCKTIENDKKDELVVVRSFFNYLKRKFQLGFINLNYDNVILSALPDLETGYNRNSGEFNRSKLHQDNWNFCYHMHGSVYFDMKGGDHVDMHGIRWNNDLNSTFTSNSSGRSKNATAEGLALLNSNIVAGLDKTNQILKEPFSAYFMRIDRLIYEADAILFVGYGFNDQHLNSLFPIIRYDNTKTRKVVILDWASNNEDGLNFRHDSWSYGVLKAIPSNAFEMGDGKSSMPNPAFHYKRLRILERSSNPAYPLAIWYNGFLEACKHPGRICAEL